MIIKVMVVEDEPPIQRDIIKLIETIDPRFRVVAAANNGRQAVELLQEQVPDLLFTDIKMPVMDGLELIQYVKDRAFDVIPVILSGYSEFAYAKQAITLGTADYLLKPVDEAELAKLLGKIAAKLRLQKTQRAKDYFAALIENKPPQAGAGKPDSDTYLVMLLCAGPFPTYTIDYYSPRRQFWRQTDLEQTVARFWEADDNWWVVDGTTGVEKVLVLALSPETLEKGRFLAQELYACLNTSKLAVTLIVSRIVNDAAEVGQVLADLRAVLSKKMIIGLPQIISGDDLVMRHESVERLPGIDSSTVNKLVFDVQQGNSAALKTEIQRIFTGWELAKYPQIWVEKCLKEIISVCQRALPEIAVPNAAELEWEINEAISLSNRYEELFYHIWYVFEELFEIRLQNNTAQDSRMILMQKIDKYLQTQLADPINTQMLSELFGLVPSYLSKLFREYKGMSPSDYLAYLRIAKAQELMVSQPELLAKEVAEIVGYADPLYFSKIFKKETGMSPSEYKRRSQKSQPDI